MFASDVVLVSPKLRFSKDFCLRPSACLPKSASGAGGGGRRRLSPQPSLVATPVPTFDRRSVVMRALGSVPLLYRHEVMGREWAPHGEKVHVYLDVSGSMDAVIASVYGAVLDSLEFVHDRIHLFSTEVKDISLRQLSHGACESTGGTSISCVAGHIREHRVRRAVILTDGYVGTPYGVY